MSRLSCALLSIATSSAMVVSGAVTFAGPAAASGTAAVTVAPVAVPAAQPAAPDPAAAGLLAAAAPAAKPFTTTGRSAAAPVVPGFSASASTVLPSLTTPTRLVYANPDGSQTVKLSTRPVRFLDGGGVWREMDFSLVPGAGGVLQARSAAPGAAWLSGSAVGAFATLPTAAGPVTLTHTDATAALSGPVLAGAASVLKGVLGGRDLRAQLTLDGVEESVVLPDRGLLGVLPGAGSYTVALGLPAGVTARAGGGGVELVGAAGAVLASYGGGYATDSATGGSGDGASSPVVSTLLGQVGQVATVKVSVDSSWLTDPARVSPVTIDPSLYANTSAESGGNYDTYTYSTAPTTAEGTFDPTAVLKVGTFDGGATVARSYLHFDTTGLTGTVSEAHLAINESYSYACSGPVPALTLFGTAAGFSRGGTTWNNQPGFDGSGAVSNSTFSYGYSSSCPGQYVNLDATSLASWWAGGAANNGIVLATDESNSYGWKKFYSGAAGSAAAPALYVTYDGSCTTYTSGPTGSHQVCGAIRDHYLALGGPGGLLGYPTTDELITPDGIGRYNHFATPAAGSTPDGSIYWTPATGAHEVHAAIRAHWAALRFEAGVLGYPVTDEAATPNGAARYNNFAKNTGSSTPDGGIYYSASTGSNEVHGLIRARWRSTGYEAGPLGLPTTDETAGYTSYHSAGNDRQNDFEHGSIYLNGGTQATNLQARPETLAGEQPFYGYDSRQLDDRVTAKVNRGTGNLELAMTDLAAPVVTGSRAVGRVYNSLQQAAGSTVNGPGILSPGWRLSDSPDLRLVSETGDVAYVSSSGNVARFTGTPGALPYTYTSPPGLDATLTKLASGGFTMRMHTSGQLLTFNAAGDLTADADRNNNTVSFAAGLNSTITGNRGSGAALSLHLTYTGPAGRLDSMCQATVAASCTGTSSTRSDTTLLVSYGYDASNNLSTVTDPAGRVTTFGYDTGNANPLARRNLIKVTSPAGTVTAFGYDSLHRVTTITADATGSPAITTYDYSQTDRETHVYDALHPRPTGGAGTYTRYLTDSTGRVTDVYDAAGQHVGNVSYSTDSKVSAFSNGAGGASSFSYGANGGESLTGTSDPTGATSSATYGCTGTSQYLPGSSTDSSGATSSYSYDGNGNQGGATNANAATATTRRNTDGTVASATDPNNGPPAASGCTAASTDGTNPTRYAYTNRQLTSITPPTGTTLGMRGFGYDPFGRTTTTGSGKNVTATYRYDRLGRVVSVGYSDSTPGVTISYDPDGNVTSRVDGTGTTRFSYDTAGRQTGRSTSGIPSCPAGASATTSCYSYDKVGNLTALADGRGTTSYSYDQLNQLISMTESSGRVDRFGYNTDHQRTNAWYNTTGTPGAPVASSRCPGNPAVAAPPGFAVHIQNCLNTANVLTRTITTRTSSNADSSRVSDLSYGYTTPAAGVCTGEPAGKVTGKRQDSTDNLTAVRTQFCYDSGGRLLSATGSTGAVFRYSYDGDGNLLSSQAGAGPVVAHSYNSGNQLTDPGTTSDGDGNTTASPSSTPALSSLGYNGTDQTTTMTATGQPTITFGYAGIDQSERTSMTSTTTSRSYSNGPVGVQSQQITSDSSGVPTGSYYYERDPNGTLIAERTPTGDFYYNLDGHGNVITLLAAADGSTVENYSYDPYGSNASTPTTAAGNANPWRYASGMLDTTTGLYHFGARYYQPLLARWTQQDSIERPGDPGQGNRYTYVGDDPINNIDPSGHCSLFDPISCTETVESYIAPVVEVGVGVTLLTLAGAACATGGLCAAGVVVGAIGVSAISAGVYLGYRTY